MAVMKSIPSAATAVIHAKPITCAMIGHGFCFAPIIGRVIGFACAKCLQ